MSPLEDMDAHTPESFPRLRGDEPKTATPKQPHFKFSPPTRG